MSKRVLLLCWLFSKRLSGTENIMAILRYSIGPTQMHNLLHPMNGRRNHFPILDEKDIRNYPALPFDTNHINTGEVSFMSFYDEVEIEDMTYHESTTLYTYPCPCGDQFEISLDDLRDGEEVAVCPSCSLQIKVIFDVVSGLC